MDSNHKLIMFRLVIHACIDGYSRRLIYIEVANNNKARTVLNMFIKGTRECGLPKRVRGDKGSENFAVKDYMFEKSENPSPYIFGRSVHNTRIERLWRDVNIQVSYIFKSHFESLEQEGVLDENNDLQVLLLSYVFLPRIQRALDAFKDNWNNHGVRTMNNWTPLQKWTVGMMQQSSSNVSASPEESDTADSDMEVSSSDSDIEGPQGNTISVPPFPTDGLDVILEECQNLVPDPLLDDGCHGMNHYRNLVSHFSLFEDGNES